MKKLFIFLGIAGLVAVAHLLSAGIPQAQATHLAIGAMASSSCAACDPLEFSFTVPASLPTSTVLVVTVGNNGSIAALGATYGGRRLATTSFSGGTVGNMVIEMYTTNNPLTGSNTVSIDMNGATNVTAGAFVFEGAAGTSSTAHVGGTAQAGNGGSQTSATVDVTGTNSSSIIIDNLILIANGGGMGAGAGQTERSEILQTNNQGVSTEPGGGTVTMSWTWVTAREWDLRAVEIQSGAEPAGAAAAPARRRAIIVQ